MAEDNVKFNERPVKIGEIAVTFDENLYDYYLSYKDMPPRYYIAYIHDVKIGFSTKYQLHKLLRTLKEMFPNDIIPEKAMQLKPIPEVSEPVIRRLGKLKVVEKKNDIPNLRSLRKTDWEYMTGTEHTNATINGRDPEGPMI